MTIRRLDFERRRCACGNYAQVYSGGVCLRCALDGHTDWLIKMGMDFATNGPVFVSYPLRSNWRSTQRAAAVADVPGGCR